MAGDRPELEAIVALVSEGNTGNCVVVSWLSMAEDKHKVEAVMTSEGVIDWGPPE